LTRQRFDQVRMSMADRSHGDAGAEVEIALARRRDQPASFPALESNIGASVGWDDGGWGVGRIHLSNSLYRLEILASRGWRLSAAK
jgi:hypothetical protein